MEHSLFYKNKFDLQEICEVKLSYGVIGNTTDFDSVEFRFDP